MENKKTDLEIISLAYHDAYIEKKENKINDHSLKNKNTKKKKQQVADIFDSDDNFLSLSSTKENEKLDPIMQMAKTITSRSKSKNKPVKDWNYTEFLRYLDSLLSTYDIHKERTSLAADRLEMGKLYDKLANIYKGSMANYILKEYIEWWVNSFGERMHGQPLFVSKLKDEQSINRFAKRYESHQSQAGAAKNNVHVESIDLYKFGGLKLLLIERGIHESFVVLNNNNEQNATEKILSTLKSFDCRTIQQVKEITAQSAYNKETNHEVIECVKFILSQC